MIPKCILGNGRSSYSRRLRCCKFIHFCRIIEFFLHSRPIPQGCKYKCVCAGFFLWTINNWLLCVSFCVQLFLLDANSVLFEIWSAGSWRLYFLISRFGWCYLQGGSLGVVDCLSFRFDVRARELTWRDRRKQRLFKPTTLVIVWCMESSADRSVSPGCHVWNSQKEETWAYYSCFCASLRSDVVTLYRFTTGTFRVIGCLMNTELFLKKYRNVEEAVNEFEFLTLRTFIYSLSFLHLTRRDEWWLFS